jgi:Mce-associated membrane protein
MSPRRKVDSGAADELTLPGDALDGDEIQASKPRRRWGLPILSTVAALLIAAGLAAGTFMVVSHVKNDRVTRKDVSVLTYVREFMTLYTTIDPFHANAYADRVLAQGTGEFAKDYKARMNEILVQIARAEPTKGTVLDAGVQRWNAADSVDVLIAIKLSTTSPDGKTPIESGSRWVVTAKVEGQRWKISNLIEVI